MTICPHIQHACHCQPQEGLMCPYGPTPNDWPKDDDAMTKQISDERLLNTRNWAEARLGQLSGAEVIVGAIDEVFALRGLLEHLHQYLPEHGRQRVVEILDGEWARYPSHDMAKALREIGALIPSATGGTFENDPPGAIVDALKRSVEPPAEPSPCEHLRSEFLAEKQSGDEPIFQMRKCLDCKLIFRVRSSLNRTRD